ncbi:MAG TPA: hypothetical protein VNO50_04385 [Pyrinomonadaceae bacterium]|nr:hypothetical protein [Pyrinomonadaceae bacterium]
MGNPGRRVFLKHTGLGLAALGAAELVLHSYVPPTRATVSEKEAKEKESGVLIQMGLIPKDQTAPRELKQVTPVSFGPWYRPGSPFRAKLSLPGEPGTTFVLSGRAWDFDTKRPLPGVVLDFWHVDMQEKYSNGVTDFRNRGRLVSSESGQYELESIRPIPYRPNPTGAPNFWRCAHYHLLAVCPGYKPLVTEIHFKGDPKISDSMYLPENAIAPEKRTVNGITFETGVFDIVLEREASSK